MSLAHFTTLFRMAQEIPYFRNCMLGMSDNIVEQLSVVFFCMQEPLPKVGVLLESLCIEKNLWTLLRGSRNKSASEETHSLENSRVVPKVLFQFTLCVEIKQEIPLF